MMKKIELGDAILYNADCREVLALLPDNSIDSIVTDPPYEIKGKSGKGGFMNKAWDATGIAFNVDMWREALRVLKPGGYLLAFSSARTFHRLVCSIEDAGFEVRDRVRFECSPETKYGAFWNSLNDEQRGIFAEFLNDQFDLGTEYSWLYGSGFPKSTDKSKIPDAWEGWNTALKPAHEPICVARKPMIGTIADNLNEFGTGALNIRDCKVPVDANLDSKQFRTINRSQRSGDNGWKMSTLAGDTTELLNSNGRWPANVIHDGSKSVIKSFPDAIGMQGQVNGSEPTANGFSGAVNFTGMKKRVPSFMPRKDSDKSAARFFYCAKPSRSERNEGLVSSDQPVCQNGATMRDREDADWESRNGNFHPTVKPLELCRYLLRLVTPPQGVTLDLFMGSGSIGVAAIHENFKYIGADDDIKEGYFDISVSRLQHAVSVPKQQGLFL